MKRVVWLLLSLVVTMLACTSAGELFSGPAPTPTRAAFVATDVPVPDGMLTVERIRSRGYLLVGVRYDLRPFGYVDAQGEVTGFDPDLGRELARRWLGSSDAVRFQQVRSDTAVEHLQTGQVDLVIAALPHRQNLEAGADFSDPYFLDGQAILVRAADTTMLTGPASLHERRVGVVDGSASAAALLAAAPVTPTLQTYDRFDAAVAALGRGDVDAVADERRRLFWGAQLLPTAVVVGQYTQAPLALAFRENDPAFANLVNLTLQEMLVDGTYAALYAQWFAPEQSPALAVWSGSELPTLADAALAAGTPDTIGAIQSRGRLSVALISNRAPFAYVDETGAPAGYEVNLVRLMAERWLGDPTAVDFTPVTYEAGVELVRTGQAELLLGGQAHTRAAELALDFSLPTYWDGESLMVMAGGPEVTDLHSLSGQQVVVVEASASSDVLLAATQPAGIPLTILPRQTLEAAIAMLMEGQAAAVAGKRSALLWPAYATPGLGLLPLRLTLEPLALGLPQGDSAFRDLVNLTLQVMKADGQLDALYAVWFSDGPLEMEVWPGAAYRTLRLATAPPPAQ